MNTKIIKTVVASLAFTVLSINPALANETKQEEKVTVKIPAKAEKTSRTTVSFQGLALPLFTTFTVSTL